MFGCWWCVVCGAWFGVRLSLSAAAFSLCLPPLCATVRPFIWRVRTVLERSYVCPSNMSIWFTRTTLLLTLLVDRFPSIASHLLHSSFSIFLRNYATHKYVAYSTAVFFPLRIHFSCSFRVRAIFFSAPRSHIIQRFDFIVVILVSRELMCSYFECTSFAAWQLSHASLFFFGIVLFSFHLIIGELKTDGTNVAIGFYICCCFASALLALQPLFPWSIEEFHLKSTNSRRNILYGLAKDSPFLGRPPREPQ